MRAVVFTDVTALAESLLQQIDSTSIYGVDGWTGSGKSVLAKSLSETLGAQHFDVDTALARDQGCYVSALDLGTVGRAINQKTGPIFVSGICLRRVFELIEVRATAHIYIKRMATWGWADECEIDGSFPEVAGSSGEQLRQEMREYHCQWRPHLSADHEFQRFC